MARVAFVQRLAFEFIGTAQLAAVLRQGGHRVAVFIAHRADDAASAALGYEPDVLCFSCTTGAHRWCLSVARRVKDARASTLVLLGGPHPTFFPEIIHEPEVDAICIGEGEAAILEVADRIDRAAELAGTPNLWHKVEGKIEREELAALHQDLDALPVPDRSVYYRRYPHLNLSRKAFFAGRGCPFNCSFCFNRQLRELYRGKGPYVRRRAAHAVVDEIVHVRRRYGLSTVYMQDDTFTLDKAWLAAFAEAYRRRVALPLVCLGRADTIDREVVSLLRQMHCRGVFLGVESGAPRIRQEVLHKPLSDDAIRRAACLLKARGIRLRTYNMVGIPTESLADAWRTVQLNADIKPAFPWCAIFQPYPRTELGDLAAEMGLVSSRGDAIGSTFFRESALNLPHKQELENLQKLFFWAVKFPLLQPLMRPLLALPANRAFDLAFLLGYAYGYLRTERLRLGELISTAVRNAGPLFLAGDED